MNIGNPYRCRCCCFFYLFNREASTSSSKTRDGWLKIGAFVSPFLFYWLQFPVSTSEEEMRRTLLSVNQFVRISFCCFTRIVLFCARWLSHTKNTTKHVTDSSFPCHCLKSILERKYSAICVIFITN